VEGSIRSSDGSLAEAQTEVKRKVSLEGAARNGPEQGFLENRKNAARELSRGVTETGSLAKTQSAETVHSMKTL